MIIGDKSDGELHIKIPDFEAHNAQRLVKAIMSYSQYPLLLSDCVNCSSVVSGEFYVRDGDFKDFFGAANAGL